MKTRCREEGSERRNVEGQEGEESGGKWGNWESYGCVKQLAQRFLTAQCCVLMPPSPRPRSEVRRNRGTGVWESVRERPEVGKFCKLNRETSHRHPGSLDWMFWGQGETELGRQKQNKRARSRAHMAEMFMVRGLGEWAGSNNLPANHPTCPPIWTAQGRNTC